MQYNEMIPAEEIRKRLRTRLKWYGMSDAKPGCLVPRPDGTVAADIKNEADEILFRAAIDPHTGSIKPLLQVPIEQSRHV